MTSLKSLSLGGLAALALALPATAADVVITIEGVHPGSGRVLGQLCSDPDGWPEAPCAYQAAVTVQGDTVVLGFFDVPDGLYAFEGFHDENDDLTLDLAVEGTVFSNGATPPRPMLDALFIVSGRTAKRVTMSYPDNAN